MSELMNPYIAGAPVTEQRMFFGREDVFDWIEKSLSGQYADHILVVHGQRRVGKTSVLKQLGNRLPKRYIPVFFDLQGRTHTTLDRFLWWLARETVRVLKQERGIEIPLPEKEDFAKDAEYFENIFLPGLRPSLGQASLLYTFDEFDNLEESEVKEELARPLTDYLRRLMGEEDINFIFSIGSSGRKLENMQAEYTEFFKTALYKKISFLSKEQTASLITRPVEGLLEYERKAVERIFGITSGHPYFTQLTCHELFSLCQRTGEQHIRESDVEAILEDVVERGTVNLKFTWDEASDIERWGLAGLAQLDKTDNRALADFLRKQRVRFSDSDLNSGLLHLREKDILTEENRFVIYLLKLWLKKNRPIEQVREELTEVNPIANRYIEIGLEFKDAGLFDKAIESFREALAVATDNIQAQVNIALTYMDQKAHDKAVLEFEKALSIDDEDVSARAGLCEAHLALGDAAMTRGRVKDAVLSYQRVLDINAEHTEARQRMAELSGQRAEKALADGKDEEALAAFSEALRYTPEDPNLIARVEKARAEKKVKVLAAQVARSEKEAAARNWDKALAALKEALETSPEDASILQKMDALRERQLQERLDAILARAGQAENAGRWDAAITALNEYLLLKPQDSKIQERLTQLTAAKRSTWLEAVLTRSKQALEAQRWDQAVAALNEVLVVEPENADFQARVVEVRQAERTARINALLKQAEQFLQTEKWDAAVDTLNEGAAMQPDDQRLQTMLARALEARRAARLNAALRLATTAAQAGKWETAVEALEGILAIEPENETVKKKLAETHQKQRESRLKALQAQARSLAGAEKFDEALAAWQDYLEMQPEDQGKALAEIEMVKNLQSLAKTYAEAQTAFTRRQYDRAAGLFKEIVVEDADYKDASHWLAESIELRRTARKWWQRKWLWGAAAGIALLTLGWFLFRPGSLLMTALIPPPTAPAASAMPVTQDAMESTVMIPPTLPPTATPTPLPLAWARVNSGQFLPRDTITVIVVNPNDPGVIFVDTKNAGMYKSIDGGTSWQPTTAESAAAPTVDNSPALRLPGECAILVSDSNDDRIAYCGIEDGIYRTTDTGQNWELSNPKVGLVNVIAISPHDPKTIFAGGQGFSISTDGRQTWEQFNSGMPNISVELKFDPRNPSILFAQDRSSGAPIYRSSDGGKNWELMRTNSCGLMFDVDGYATCGFWKSYDNGTNWTNIFYSNILGYPISGYPAAIGAEYPSSSNSLVYFPEKNLLFLSQDNGKSWQDIPSTFEQKWGSDFRFFFDHDKGQVVYAIDPSKFQPYRSDDGGRTWTGCSVIPVLPSASDTRLAIDHQDSSHILLATRGGGALKSHDACKTWKASNTGLDNDFINSIVIDPVSGSIYAGTNGGAYVSFDGGQTWHQVNDGLLGATVVYSIVVDKDSNVYAATPYGIFKLESK